MSLENVLNEIHSQGQKEIANIFAEGKQEAERIMAEAKEKLKKIEAAKKKETDDKIKQLRIQELSIAELDAKKNVLNMQKGLLDKLRKEVLQKLKEMPADKNQQFLAKLIERSKIEFESGKVYCNSNDERYVKANAPFTFGGTINCIGGILVENDDGSINMDFRYESILDDIWKDVMKDVSKVLFSQE